MARFEDPEDQDPVPGFVAKQGTGRPGRGHQFEQDDEEGLEAPAEPADAPAESPESPEGSDA
ncbi:MAG: hypothetical protein IT304_09780 [Dehalococcoidia bacterium]|nr:hypothetical protein [Dehalococcoidia bacterium]